ncbi:MAG: sugar porter family MFS transporter [Pseudomonadota bacterium]|nr:sugar porter family MFS transporter [Pseudomonadota bacterium]
MPHTVATRSSTSGHGFLYLGVAVVSLSGLLFGYDTGVVSGALLFLKVQYHLTPTMQEIVTSVVLVGAVLGAVGSGQMADRLGRRRLMIVTSAIFLVGIVITAVALNVAILIVGRIVVGVGIGVASYLGPLYISEISPAGMRGGLVALNQLLLTLGILVSYFVDYGLSAHGDWRWMFGLAAIPALALGIGMIFLPESPRWLLQKDDKDRAVRALTRLDNDGQVQHEIASIQRDLSQQSKRVGWADLITPTLRAALMVGLGLAAFDQLTGINTIIYYTPTIFQLAGLGSAAHSILASVSVGVVNVVMTMAAVRLVDRVGRRPLLLWGIAGMIVGLFLIGLSFRLHGHLQGWLAASSLMLYVGAFAIGLGPVFWLLISEIYPLQVRGLAMSVATLTNWGFNLLVTVSFLTLVHAVGLSWTFWAYGLVSVGAWLFAKRFVPETKGRSLEQIERELTGSSHGV